MSEYLALTKWDHVPVDIWNADGSPETLEEIQSKVLDALQSVSGNGCLAMIPPNGFRLLIKSTWALAKITLIDESFPARNYQDSKELPCGVMLRHDDANPVDISYQTVIDRFIKDLKHRWPQWLEWRKRRRKRPDPEWLAALRDQRKTGRAKHGGC